MNDGITELFRDPPRLHRDGHGQAENWGIDARLEPILRAHVFSGSMTLEIGAGLSTIALLALGARHTVISPDAGELARVAEYCDARGISRADLQVTRARSADALPALPASARFDFILIDGDHAFPLPAVDWHYSVRHLKKGGIVVLDDIQLDSGRMVADFMASDRECWEILARNERFVVARLQVPAREAQGRGWQAQGANFSTSEASSSTRPGGAPPLGSTALKRVLSLAWAPARVRKEYNRRFGGTVTKLLRKLT